MLQILRINLDSIGLRLGAIFVSNEETRKIESALILLYWKYWCWLLQRWYCPHLYFCNEKRPVWQNSFNFLRLSPLSLILWEKCINRYKIASAIVASLYVNQTNFLMVIDSLYIVGFCICLSSIISFRSIWCCSSIWVNPEFYRTSK